MGDEKLTALGIGPGGGQADHPAAELKGRKFGAEAVIDAVESVADGTPALPAVPVFSGSFQGLPSVGGTIF